MRRSPVALLGLLGLSVFGAVPASAQTVVQAQDDTPAPAFPVVLPAPTTTEPAPRPEPPRPPRRPRTIAFQETDLAGHPIRQLTLLLTDTPATAYTDTCGSVGGAWRQAVALADASAYSHGPVYTLAAGRLEVVLVDDICTRHDAYVGTLTGPVFEGRHVITSPDDSRLAGRVTGHYDPPASPP